MKKIFCLIAVFALAFTLFACGEEERQIVTEPSSATTTTQKTGDATTTATEVTVPVTSISDGGYIYSQEDDGIVITGYVGTETDLVIPQTIDGKQVVEIGFEAFRNGEIKSVEIPFGVRKIGAFAFFSTPLERVEIPETVTFIGNNAFSYTNLTEFETPLGISGICAETFSFCEQLESVIIGDNVTQIDYGAFAFCPLLEAVYIPYSVDYVADDAFEGCFDIVIYGEEESYVEQFAEDMNFRFEIV